MVFLLQLFLNQPLILIENTPIPQFKSIKFLGIIVD